ncbi:hypothetical protein ABT112_12860 [Streptomyces sp. NPDC002055]|uniref:hypothetical protein n=1 Tax=Streptomyces sp. NPDC002055 TaxID=3154534 RepID=UPI0033254D81
MTGIQGGAEGAAPGGGSSADDGRQGKTSFDDIYDRPDPRAYFRGLQPLEYQTPLHAQPVFRRLLAARAAAAEADADAESDADADAKAADAPERGGAGRGGAGAQGGPGRPVTVLDVCCSYGINAALLNHDITLDELYRRYTSPDLDTLTDHQRIEEDREFYAGRRSADPAPVVGLDAARHAVAYATAAGLLTAGFGEDLEHSDPSPGLVRALEPVRLITVTGGVGYITSRTFERILRPMTGPVWVAAFVLRTVDYGPIADTLASFGLVTEHAADRSYRQRRFSDDSERRHALEAVRATGRSPEGRETDGSYHSEFHLSRPAAHAEAFPVEDVLDGR